MKIMKRPKKNGYNRYTIQALLLTLLALIAYQASSSGVLDKAFKSGLFQKVKEATSDLEVHFLDVGQGDCILLMCEGEAMLIDAGENDAGQEVVDYLEYQNLDKLEYIVATHPDSDHIGGMDNVLKNIECDEIFMTDDKKDTKTYEEVIDIIEDKDIKVNEPEVNESFELGCSMVTIIAPVKNNEDVNNNSIVLKVTHGAESFLFTGDAEIQEMTQIIDSGADVSANVYKAAHHGSRTAVEEQFLNEVNAEFAVISCGEGNSYGHPHADALLYLHENNIATFRTDEQGTIVAISDGEGITWNCSPSESWQSGDR